MNKKYIFLGVWAFIMLIPLIILILLNSIMMPDLYYSFENGFENELMPDTSLISYGNMAFTDHAPKGKGLELQDGFLNINGSNKFKLKDSFTFSCWLKFKTLDAKNPMILSRASQNGDPYSGPFSITFSEDFSKLSCSLTFKMKDGTEKTHTFTSGTLFKPARLLRRWHHIAVTFNENYLCFYTDGELRSTIVLPEEFDGYKSILNTDRFFSFGRCLDTNMNAYLDEIYLYSENYDYNKIAELYSRAKSQSTTEILLFEKESFCKINGKEHTLSASVLKDKESGEFLVPAKSVLSLIGGTIYWDENDGLGRADINLSETKVSLWAYDTHATINSGYYKLKTHPQLTEDKILLVPASLFEDIFGAEVDYKQDLSPLTITY